MFKFFILPFILCLSFNILTQEGIQTKNELGVEALVKDVFIKGSCRNVANITSIGDEILSIGQFESGASSIGIDEGLVISTGDIEIAQGSNIFTDGTYSFDEGSNIRSK